MSELKQAWEYSFIHSSATGRGDEEIGPCLTYDKAAAFGKGCIKQREVFIRTQPEATKDDSLRTSLADLATALWRTHYRNDSPNFELLPDSAGILSQIDNMVSGLVKPEATKPAQDLGAAILEQAAQACDQQADGTNGAYRSACLQCANAVRELRDAALASPAQALSAVDSETVKDALRYRYLRNAASSVEWIEPITSMTYKRHCYLDPKLMDAAIDAILQSQEAKK